MSKLAITVPLNVGETASSYLSRLAQGNGRDRARAFALDVGLDYSGVAAGRAGSLVDLASRGGCSLDVLTAWTAVEGNRGHFTLRGQNLGCRKLRRVHAYACVSCLLCDRERDEIEYSARFWGRALWQVPGLRTCHIHGQAFTKMAVSESYLPLHDFSALILPEVKNLEALDCTSVRRPASQLEAYVRERLERGTNAQCWPDTLPLYAIIRLSENLGTLHQFGPHAITRLLTEHDYYRAGAAGFEALSDGEVGIRRVLTEVQSSRPNGFVGEGAATIFGRLYQWLSYECDDPAYDPVRDVMFRHVVETMPVGPGEVIFGREVTARRSHSLHSASIEYGLHPKRLRKILIDKGMIKRGDHYQTNGQILLDVGAVGESLSTLSEAMSLREVEEYLNAPRVQARLLLDAGIISPTIRGRSNGFKNHAFAKSDLDCFLERLTSGARSDLGPGLYPIPNAAKRANCSALRIVGFLLERQLKTVGVNPASRGYLSLLVDVAEVRQLVQRRKEHEGITLRALEQQMSWSSRVVKGLVDGGHIQSVVTDNRVRGGVQRVVMPSDLETFNNEYVSLFCLARERNLHITNMKMLLVTAGIHPDPALVGVPASFYRRAEVNLLP